jgi:hypothetical protein
VENQQHGNDFPTMPGKEVSAEDFGKDLLERVEAYRRGEIGSSSLEETRAIINLRLSGGD